MERLPEGVGIYPLASEMNMDLLTMAVQLLKLKGHTGSWPNTDCIPLTDANGKNISEVLNLPV